MLARITTKGQVTLPRRIRSALRLTCGDYIDFKFRGERVLLEKKMRHSTACDLVGIVQVKRHYSSEDISGAKKAAVLAKWGRK